MSAKAPHVPLRCSRKGRRRCQRTHDTLCRLIREHCQRDPQAKRALVLAAVALTDYLDDQPGRV